MGVMRRVGVLAGFGADHVRADLAAGQFVEAERPILEEGPEPIGLETVRPR